MRTWMVGVMGVVVSVLGMGCAPQQPKEMPPPPPPKVAVTVPDGDISKDEEGVRRVAVSLTLEAQANGRKVGRGFSSGGREVELELVQPLDEVVSQTVASAFKEMGFNVRLAGPVEPESSAVRTEVERAKADYMAVPTIGTFEVSTTPTENAPAFGRVRMLVQVYGAEGDALVNVPVTVNRGWTLKGGKPGEEQLRVCVEEMLKEIKGQIVSNAGVRSVLGLGAEKK